MWRTASLVLTLILVASAASAGPPAPAGKMMVLQTAYHTTFEVYVAGPEQAAYGALLVPDRWGLNRRVRAWADRLAALGYRVMAVDYFDGRRVPNRTMSRIVIKAIDPVWVAADLKAAFRELARPGRRIVTVSWGRGAAFAAREALAALSGPSALIAYHEADTPGINEVKRLNLPLLEVVSRRSLLDPGDADSDRKSRKDAWQATVKFLHTNFELSPHRASAGR